MSDRTPRPAAQLAPRLAGLATAVPPHTLDQQAVIERVRILFGGRPEIERLLPVFTNAGIETRHSCVPIEWYAEPHGWADRNAIYLDSATKLLEQAAREAMTQAGVAPAEIGSVVTVSTTGIATPSLEARLAVRLGLQPTVRRTPLFGLGCGGGVIGLSRAAAQAASDPDHPVLLLVVELCALSFRKNDAAKNNIVATALFGDGAAAAVLSTGRPGPALGPAGEHTWPDTLDIMGWSVEDDGMRAIFSRDIPALVRERLAAPIDTFLGRHGLARRDIAAYACHPGGTKVIDALEEMLVAPGMLDDGRAVLRDNGNMSAATVLFVLRRMLDRGLPGRTLAAALGPGFSAGFQIIEP